MRLAAVLKESPALKEKAFHTTLADEPDSQANLRCKAAKASSEALSSEMISMPDQ